MKELPRFTRRDAGFLSFAGFVPKFDLAPPTEKQTLLDWQDIGPFVPEYNTQVENRGSEGIRALYVDPTYPKFIIGATWQHGVRVTGSGGGETGREWQTDSSLKFNYPERFEVLRDFITYPGASCLAIGDYGVYRRGLYGNFEAYKFPWDANKREGLFAAQTGLLASNGTLLLGGYYGVIYFKGVLDKPEALKDTQNWRLAPGIPREGNYKIRTLVQDEKTGEIFAGGWGGQSEGSFANMREGLGLWVSRDNGESFQPHELADKILDSRGRLNINSINITYAQGKRLMFIGGEGGGAGREGDRPYSSDYPSFFTIVGSEVQDASKTNVYGLCRALGQDLITPQRGIVTSIKGARVFVSSWSQHIASCKLESILKGELYNWERVTSVKEGDLTFGAGHLYLSTDNTGQEYLFSGGQTYVHKTPHRFVPIRVARI